MFIYVTKAEEIKNQNDSVKNIRDRLVLDVLKEGAETTDEFHMDKIIVLLWYFRDDISVLKYFSNRIAKNIYKGDHSTLEKVESYLAQLGNMIIHLEAERDPEDAVLEKLALTIAQKSLHFALLYQCFLQVSLGDFIPELPNGLPNPNYNAVFYKRCVKLLIGLERCFLAGHQQQQQQGQCAIKGDQPKTESSILCKVTNLSCPLQLETKICKDLQKANLNSVEHGETYVQTSTLRAHFEGLLWFQKCKYKKQKNEKLIEEEEEEEQWELLYFVIEDKMLHCYENIEGNSKGTKEGKLLRALQLDGATIVDETNESKLEYKFVISNFGIEFLLKASTEGAKNLWIKTLTEESDSFVGLKKHRIENNSITNCSSDQLKKHEIFINTMKFFRQLTDLPDIIRDEEFHQRQSYGERQISTMKVPSSVYFPFCNPQRLVGYFTPKHIDVLSSYRRCVTVLHFMSSKLEKEPVTNSSLELLASLSSSSTLNNSNSNNEECRIIPKTIGTILESYKMSSTDKGKHHYQRADTKLSFDSLPLEGTDRTDISTFSGDTEENLSGDDHSSISSHDSVEHEIIKPFWVGDIIPKIDNDTNNNNNNCNDKMKTMKVPSLLVKAYRFGDPAADLRMECTVMQLVYFFKRVFMNANLDLWLRPYQILSTTSLTGVVEVINAISITKLQRKAQYPKKGGLRKYFEDTYGPPESASFKLAQRKFVQSLAGSAVVTYILGIKDRHKDNTMIDDEGHIFDIDFAWALGLEPPYIPEGYAPFKLTGEYIEVMGGLQSDGYEEFKRLFVAGMIEARRNAPLALCMLDAMTNNSSLPCFSKFQLSWLEKKLMVDVPDDLVADKALRLIEWARFNPFPYIYETGCELSLGLPYQEESWWGNLYLTIMKLLV